ncbi:hypothetical protein BBJ28_00018443 [Nothophytophthora sp. Chile5]|nr:hypothetical protein BBJ28_00018443 [Nothophytophthora sp. Chile5]
MDTPSLPLPEQLTCRLAIKNGDALMPCRNKAPPVESFFASQMAGACPEAFRSQLQTVWHTALLTSEGQAGFMLMLFVYVPKTEQPITMRRATATRIQEQMPRVASLLQQLGVPTGGATHTYLAVTQAHLPEGSELEPPESATFDQLRHIDSQQSAIDARQAVEQQLAEQEYVIIRVKIQNIPAPLQVNLADVRKALGSPAYRLCPPFRAPRPVSVPPPYQDMVDVDHLDE